MPPSELRKEARESLRGNWGKAVSIILAYLLFAFVLGMVEGFFEENRIIFSLIEIAFLVISMPLSFGLTISFIKLKRGEDVKAFSFLKEGFSRFSKSWGIWFNTFIRMLLPIACVFLVAILLVTLNVANILSGTNVLLTILSIVLYVATLIYVFSRALLYAVAYYIGYDNSALSSKACVLKSEELMKGNRGSLFLLELSFIGWAILGAFTLGIGYIWLLPYMQVAFVCFYDRLAKPEVKKIEEEIKIEE